MSRSSNKTSSPPTTDSAALTTLPSTSATLAPVSDLETPMEISAPDSMPPKVDDAAPQSADPLNDNPLDKEYPGLPNVAKSDGIFQTERSKRSLPSPNKHQNASKSAKKAQVQPKKL